MKLLIAVISLLFLSNGFAQKSNFRSRSELGVLLGGSYYIGDLNQYEHFKNTHPAIGLLYKYNLNPRVALRGNFTYGTVSASDAQSRNSLMQNRNLSFASDLYEVAAGIEFSYFPFQIGHSRYNATAYLIAEIGIFQMNPTADFNGERIELQSLGTEGQGTSLSSRGAYSKTQLCVPLGFGCKISLGKNVSLNFEYAIRKTFTDYLDDVGANRYVNTDDLAATSGPLVAAMSNRSLDGSRYGKRGNSTTKDWYAFFGAMVSFRIGKPPVCAGAN